MEIEQWEMVNGECKRRKTQICAIGKWVVGGGGGGGGGGGRESGKWQVARRRRKIHNKQQEVTKGVKIFYNRTQWGVHSLWTQTSGGNMPNV
jgi:hypothetical protein